MPKLSDARIKARIEVLKDAASWIEDQATGASSSEAYINSTHNTELLEDEAIKLSKRLFKDAEKLTLALEQNNSMFRC